MDPHLRWLRRLVVARTAERLVIEAGIVGLAVAVGAGAAGWAPAMVALTVVVAVPSTVLARLGLALTTNPITLRYLLWWTDPSVRLQPSKRTGPARPEDAVASELQSGSFAFLVRLERQDGGPVEGPNQTDGQADSGEDDGPTGIEVYRAEGGRLIVTRSDDDEVTVISRLADGRTLVTSAGFVPPTAALLVQRGGARPGQIPTDTLIEHVERLLDLREAGVEAVVTGVDDVIDLVRAEWEAWQEIGPFIGPLIAIGWRRWPRLSLQVEVPDQLVRARAFGLRATASRTRSRAASD